ncbi:DUF4126 domain-containing protein [Nocardioides sp.]|uniref:DUF4126 domain-containing protein n=1 Tax=Nocardioides sp. TaxID=35761 RepID=UPI00271BCCBA|nr:DUF4126 domain-containing protein [Nocardioides sp.]MDO9454734.1 DUF4126 domain-containing protein [Nocardioides sp.]
MESLALSFSSGWASGVNAYLVVLVLGVGQRLGATDAPEVLGRWDVLAAAAFMYAIEFVADKIPYVDSAWDAISTVIRPTAGAVVGVLVAGDADSLDQAVSASVGGASALASHLVKAGGRLAINSSPEPVTNITASVVEDFVVLGLVAFAISHPVAAASVAAVFLVVGLVVVWFALKLVRRGWRRFRDRRSRRAGGPGGPPGGPAWT